MNNTPEEWEILLQNFHVTHFPSNEIYLTEFYLHKLVCMIGQIKPQTELITECQAKWVSPPNLTGEHLHASVLRIQDRGHIYGAGVGGEGEAQPCTPSFSPACNLYSNPVGRIRLPHVFK